MARQLRGNGGVDRGAKKEGVKGWTKSSSGEVKINVDAFVVKEGVGVGLGVACRDDRGSLKWMAVEQRRAVRDPREAEAEALLLGMKKAVRRGHRDVTMESDCQVLINSLKTRVDGISDFHLIYEDIFYACDSFRSVKWSFVVRESNKVAHEIARLAPWEGVDGNGRLASR
ncbi:uncharacterized protein LOC141629626 [Silene latifolia]|uniref:uncharacterized protein LOC141629626 n=1 Tax=Silene latifolia TaxID=37657 RepID=UPI003D76AD07